ncbi:coiled-coil domain-containing protein 69 [Ictalurus punctatus]|uniref:Coiled-coil domain-containing protein 69 n=1 Tax=Ictalurus punctatus TaxID=7998 RepID=A0A2D0RL18_ICTPU|nr:coiled-coil domain-containing protein 69 [Ictalurus punctatus]
MGCHNSKVCVHVRRKKKKQAKNETPLKEISSAHDGSGKSPSEEKDSGPESQLEKYEWQLKILDEVLAASGSEERDQLLKAHQHGDLCVLVHTITEMVKSETAAELGAVHENQMKSSTEQHQREVEEMKNLHSEEKNTLQETHITVESALKEQIEQLTADLKLFTEIKQRVKESMLKRDLQRNIQTHGSPGEFWEQEQESLLIVIEMKSERLLEQGNKLRQMEALVEKNLALEDQVLQVLQQNEDLRVRIDNYQTLIHQLSKEQNELQEALEKQTLQRQKLVQEKEELLFKLLHRRDSCSSFHIPAVVPAEVSPS